MSTTDMNDGLSDVERICQVIRKYRKALCKLGLYVRDDDQYEPEAQILLDRICDVELTAQYVRDVWLVMFACSERSYGSMRSRRVVKIGDMPMRPVFRRIADELNRLFPDIRGPS